VEVLSIKRDEYISKYMDINIFTFFKIIILSLKSKYTNYKENNFVFNGHLILLFNHIR